MSDVKSGDRLRGGNGGGADQRAGRGLREFLCRAAFDGASILDAGDLHGHLVQKDQRGARESIVMGSLPGTMSPAKTTMPKMA